jgi:hypothetical protein
MHEMRAAVDLDVALDWRGLEGVEQPASILIRDETVPSPRITATGACTKAGS